MGIENVELLEAENVARFNRVPWTDVNSITIKLSSESGAAVNVASILMVFSPTL